MKRTIMAILCFMLAASILYAGANEDLINGAKKGNIDAVKTAINEGANINAISNSGYTALMFASGNGHTEIVKLLLKTELMSM